MAANNMVGTRPTRFSVVRYGNVVGSRGSVVPFFQKLIGEKIKELPITDERMTRFWITLQQGVDFVLKSFERMQGGEIFVPKIRSMKIVDLATTMAPNLPIKIIGVRAGEKLHEVMCPGDNYHLTLDFSDHYVIMPTIEYPHRVNYSCNCLGENGVPVPDGFQYSSDLNTDWITGQQLLGMIGQ